LTDSQVKDRYNGLPIPSEYVGADNVDLTAGSFIAGKQYTILTIGTTDFTSIGASANTIGIEFTATGVGAGTGTATSTGNILNLSTGKQDANWIDSDHDISATVTGATLNNLQGVSGTNGFFEDDLKVLGDVTLEDNGKALFGTGNDLEIYHNGTNSIIEPAINNSEDLYVGGIGKSFTRIWYNAYQEHVFGMDGSTKISIDDSRVWVADDLTVVGGITTTQYKVSALNTAPSSATDTGTLGEIRYTADYIYVCTATNTWKRTAIATW
jgi:hypothetical protein